jgi:hypothetical protein
LRLCKLHTQQDGLYKKQQGDIFRKNVFMSHKTAPSGPLGLLGLMQTYLTRASKQGNRNYIHESDQE